MTAPLTVELPAEKAEELRALARTRDIGLAAARALQASMELLAAQAGVPLDQYRYLSVSGNTLIARTEEHLRLEAAGETYNASQQPVRPASTQ